MWAFQLEEDIIGMGKKGDVIVVQEAPGPDQSLVRPMVFNPGRLLLHLVDGQVTPLCPDGFSALVRLAASRPLPPARPASQRRRAPA